jgi:hypothetical protein
MSSVPDNTSCDLKFANIAVDVWDETRDHESNKIDTNIDAAMVVQGFRRYELKLCLLGSCSLVSYDSRIQKSVPYPFSTGDASVRAYWCMSLARIWQYVTSKESLVTGSMILGSYSLPRNLCKLLVEVRTTIRYQSWSILGSGCI